MKKYLIHLFIAALLPFAAAAKNLKIHLTSGEETIIHIINDGSLATIKRSVDVRVDERHSEAELKDIADAILKSDRRKFQRVFIMIYLPEMEVGAGAWATAIYSPELKIRILGSTKEEYAKLLSSNAEDANEEIIAWWLDGRPFVERKIELIVRDSTHFIRSTFKDGSGSTQAVEIEDASRGKRISTESGRERGEFYVFSENGSLEFWDADGRYYIAKKKD